MIIYSRNLVAQTSDGNLTRLTTVGPQQDEVKVNDQNTQQYLEGILEQLRILNFQMGTLTDNHIDETGE